jgi:hypothetical protein
MSGNSVTLTCPKCGVVNTPRGKAMTLAMTCTGCHVYFRVGAWNKTTIKFANSTELSIPLGAKGKIDGTVYEVMGFVVKRENKYKYQWREYLLFNPFMGYAFLSEYNGNWNFVWPVEDSPASKIRNSFNRDGATFHLYQKYQSEVVLARGEFFFDVVDITETTTNMEYISPPHLYAREASTDSVIWCKGEYITPGDVATAFKLSEKQLPKKQGLGYTEPVVGNFHPNTLIRFSLLLAFFIILLQLYFSNSSQDREVFKGTYHQSDLKNQKFFVTPTFTLEGESKNLSIDITTTISNDWFFAEFSLINEATGIEYNFTKDLEYYYGYDEGAWTEGSTKGDATLSQIPGGKYHINIYPEFSTSSHSFSIVVKRDVPVMSNFITAMILLALFPVGYFLRRRHLERKRWGDSDYTPSEY